MHFTYHITTFAVAMPFGFHINILDLVFKGMLIGVIASAPMGPVGVLCVQRTLNKGRWFGFITGLGAALSDIFYALITGLGMSFVMDIVNRGNNRFWLQISGSIMLLGFGIWCYMSNPKKNIRRPGRSKGSLVHNGITAFMVTISNPLIIFLFMACFAQWAFVVPDHPWEMSAGYIGIFLGAMLWWYGLTWLVDKIRLIFDDNGIILINRVIGCVVMIFSVLVLICTVFNIYTFSL